MDSHSSSTVRSMNGAQFHLLWVLSAGGRLIAVAGGFAASAARADADGGSLFDFGENFQSLNSAAGVE